MLKKQRMTLPEKKQRNKRRTFRREVGNATRGGFNNEKDRSFGGASRAAARMRVRAGAGLSEQTPSLHHSLRRRRSGRHGGSSRRGAPVNQSGAAGGADEALAVLLQELAVEARLEVVALDARERTEPEEVVHPLRALAPDRKSVV